MGEVYLAEDTELGRTVALKVLAADVASDRERMHRFKQEARATSTLNHPNILTIHEIGQAGALYFIATEFIDGETLREHMRLRGAGMRLVEVLGVAIQVADALAAAHEAGIIHRDLKPENIMIRRRDAYVKVLDFGLAKLIEQRAATVDGEALTKSRFATDPGMVFGTLQYMSPEQARGLDVDARTDVFSLGIVLYEMSTGHLPFDGQTKTDVVAAILDKEPPPLARYSREVPDMLEWIVTKALRKDRDARYQTAKELSGDLKELRQRLEFAAEQERSLPPASGSETIVTTSGGLISAETVKEQKTQTEKTARPTTSAEHLVSQLSQHKRGVILALTALVLAALGIFLGTRYSGRNKLTTRPEPFGKIRLTKLTTNGKAGHAAVSPDGKYLAYVTGDPGQQSIWLKHIATGSEKEIAPQTGFSYCCTFFSHDGNHVYYEKATTNVPSTLYQVPVLGGTTRTIMEDVDSWAALSPDSKQLAFIRGDVTKGIVELIVANVDGTGARPLFTHDIANFFPTGNTMFPAWSPDGEIIVIRLPLSDASGNYWRLLAVRVKDGTTRQITSQRWSTLGQFGWLSNGGGLVFTASDPASGQSQQIWYASYPGGEVRKVTNDVNNYLGISLTAHSEALVTLQRDQTANIWISPNGEASRAAQITSNKYEGLSGIAFAPDGRVVYTSKTSGRESLWIANADATDPKQLTADTYNNTTPTVSPDGRYVVFVSDRTGAENIWRIDINGANPKQLTNGKQDRLPDWSSDGQWVIYTSSNTGKQTLWRVSNEGGNPVQLTDYPSAGAVISPDGKQIACGYYDEQAKPPGWMVAIIPLEGGQPIKKFDTSTWPLRLRWTKDGRALTYALTRAGTSNIWSQPVDGGKPAQLTEFKSDRIYFFDWSHDGRQLALSRGTVTGDVVLIEDSEQSQ